MGAGVLCEGSGRVARRRLAIQHLRRMGHEVVPDAVELGLLAFDTLQAFRIARVAMASGQTIEIGEYVAMMNCEAPFAKSWMRARVASWRCGESAASGSSSRQSP